LSAFCRLVAPVTFPRGCKAGKRPNRPSYTASAR
jgi:hypothetical protein